MHRHTPGFYEKYIKRVLDVVLSAVAFVVLSPLLIVTSYLVKTKLGSPVLFTQERPGKDGKIFKLYKFRTMTNETDADGNLLPDDIRLTPFGKTLRSTSIDELPELINILKGDMSVVGPRPQLVRDMVFMTEEQNMRHIIRPGLTGLAQANGRNNITWEEKFQYDLKYIADGITFLHDAKIVLNTVGKVLKRSDTVREGTVSDMDFGDWLMVQGKICQDEYDAKQAEAKRMMRV